MKPLDIWPNQWSKFILEDAPNIIQKHQEVGGEQQDEVFNTVRKFADVSEELSRTCQVDCWKPQSESFEAPKKNKKLVKSRLSLPNTSTLWVVLATFNPRVYRG